MRQLKFRGHITRKAGLQNLLHSQYIEIKGWGEKSSELPTLCKLVGRTEAWRDNKKPKHTYSYKRQEVAESNDHPRFERT